VTRRPSTQRVLLAIALLFLALAATYQMLSLEGIQGHIWSHMYPGTTEWAPGYSGWAFWKIFPGMSKDQVRELVGEPLDTYTRSGDDDQLREYWRYSRSPTSSHFHDRTVIFDQSGHVKMRLSEYYID
jgi:SmpA/OmlA family protein